MTQRQTHLEMTNLPSSVKEIEISVVIPIYNEAESLPLLIPSITQTLNSLSLSYEIIIIDDGSTDETKETLQRLSHAYSQLKAIILRRNYGQTAALAAGFNYAKGKIIITLDGDLQNDPQDIPQLIDKLNEGYDVVSGWRKNRQDDKLTRLLPSKIANHIIGRVLGVKLHDYGCSLKAYRAEVIADLNLYGELHRFLPALAYIEGAKIAEIPVNHYARKYGKSKYGLGRIIRVLMDLLTVFFMKQFLTRPMHIFGGVGLGTMTLGLLIGAYLTFLKLALNESIGNRPLLILAVLLVIIGVQWFSLGLLAEILMRTYHESQERPIYRVREVMGDGQK